MKSKLMKKLSLAFSSCPNDTFMMYAIVHKKIDLSGIEFDVEIMDIEKLNQAAISGRFDVSKASAALFPEVSVNYFLLNSGAAFGIDGGPILIAGQNSNLNEESTIAIPGEYTSAHALFKRYYKEPCKKEFVLFSDIFALISSGRADAGVVIHEDRFTFWQHGFECVSDLGLEWKKETALPVPLGIFIAKSELSDAIRNNLNRMITQSIEYARLNYDEVFPWVKEYARNEHPDVIRKHIDYYVNVFSTDMGKEGMSALRMLWNE